MTNFASTVSPPPKKLAMAAIAVSLSLLVIEGAARVYEALAPSPPARPLPRPGPVACLPDCMPGLAPLPDQPRGLPQGIAMVPHPQRGWMLPPNTVMVETNVRTRVNSLGLRGPEIPTDRAAGEIRLLTLGDSSIFGYAVEETAELGAVAARHLADRWGVPVRAINGGTPGHTALQALGTLEEVGPLARPDWVVIGCLWSDLFQTDIPLDTSVAPAVPLAAYRLAHRWLAPWLPAREVGWVDPERGVGVPQAGRSARTGLQRYRRALSDLVSEVQRHGGRPAFVILPAPVDLDSGPVPSYIADYRLALFEAATSAQAPVVDGPTLFAANGATNADFYDQVHPSTSGHARLGAALAQMIAAVGPPAAE